MKTVINTLFYILILVSCTKENPNQSISKSEPILIRIGFQPTNRNPVEFIVNLKEKYLTFFSPDSFGIPPPLNTINNKDEHDKFMLETKEITPFYAKLENQDIESILKIINSFSKEDFHAINTPPKDGLWMNFIIVYSDNKIKEFHTRPSANQKQIELYKQILKFATEKNSDENNSQNLKVLNSYN